MAVGNGIKSGSRAQRFCYSRSVAGSSALHGAAFGGCEARSAFAFPRSREMRAAGAHKLMGMSDFAAVDNAPDCTVITRCSRATSFLSI